MHGVRHPRTTAYVYTLAAAAGFEPAYPQRVLNETKHLQQPAVLLGNLVPRERAVGALCNF